MRGHQRCARTADTASANRTSPPPAMSYPPRLDRRRHHAHPDARGSYDSTPIVIPRFRRTRQRLDPNGSIESDPAITARLDCASARRVTPDRVLPSIVTRTGRPAPAVTAATTRSARAWWCPSLNLAERLQRSHSVSGWWARRWAHGSHVRPKRGARATVASYRRTICVEPDQAQNHRYAMLRRRPRRALRLFLFSPFHGRRHRLTPHGWPQFRWYLRPAAFAYPVYFRMLKHRSRL